MKLRLGLPARIFAILHWILPRKMGDRMWRWWYQRLAKANEWGNLNFMNYGFIDEDQPTLEQEDEKHRLFIQLYHMNIRDIELTDKDVLEVGSGRGGGASWIARTYSPASLVALDYSLEAVKLCTQLYANQETLEFIEGNAMSLPFKPSSFDVVYNVESSHCYSDMNAFIKSVYSTLRPGGTFAWTDFREKKKMDKIHQMFIDSGFEIIKESNITSEVLNALDQISDDKKERIGKSTSKVIRRSFETFAGIRGTPVYESFRKGTLQYYRYLLRK